MLAAIPAIGQTSRCLLDARVSTKNPPEAGNLDRQFGRLTTLATEPPSTVVAALTDVTSGFNEKRRGLHPLPELAPQHQADIALVEDQHRLVRFGFAY